MKIVSPFEKAYQEYIEYIISEWELGAINELEEDGFITKEIIYNTPETHTMRPLTREEFKQTKFKIWQQEVT